MTPAVRLAVIWLCYLGAAAVALALCAMLAGFPALRPTAKRVAGGVVGSIAGILVGQMLTIPVIACLWLLFWCVSRFTGQLDLRAQLAWNLIVIVSFVGTFLFGTLLGFVVGWRVGSRVAVGSRLAEAIYVHRIKGYSSHKLGPVNTPPP